MDSELINTLKKFNLSTYEAKAYIALTSIISGTAVEVSQESGIPRSKVYDVLKNLKNKNFVEIIEGKPLKYEVISPKIAFTEHKKELINTLNKNEEKLIELYEKKISQIKAPVWLIPTQEKINSKEIDLIKSARKKINMRIGFITNDEFEILIKTFKKLSPNVKIKILTTKECYINAEKINLIKKFEKERIPNLKIKPTSLPFVRLIIKDEKEMFHIYAKQDSKLKTPIENTYMGIWNRYEDVCGNYDERFEKQFNNKK